MNKISEYSSVFTPIKWENCNTIFEGLKSWRKVIIEHFLTKTIFKNYIQIEIDLQMKKLNIKLRKIWKGLLSNYCLVLQSLFTLAEAHL